MQEHLLLSVQDLRVSLPAGGLMEVDRFELAAGGIVILFGPIGCGKTTLLQLICGLTPPSAIAVEGTILVAGTDSREQPAHKAEATLVWQDHRLFDHMSILDNVAYPFKAAGRRWPIARVAAQELLKEMGLAHLAERRTTHELSGGETQLIAIARGVARVTSGRARVLLLDEPFRSLSRMQNLDIQRYIRHLVHARGLAAIIVSHALADILTERQPIAVIRDGTLRQFLSIDELFADRSCCDVVEELGLLNRVDGTTFIPPSEVSISRALPSTGTLVEEGTIERLDRSAFGVLVTIRLRDDRLWVAPVSADHGLSPNDRVFLTWGGREQGTANDLPSEN